MSFTSNPFQSITIVVDGLGEITWECDSCGGHGSPFTVATRYQTLRDNFDIHLKRSHNLNKNNPQGWYAR